MQLFGNHWVLRKIFFIADTTTIRLILANASIFWSISLILQPETFNRPAYEIMRVFGNAYVWAAAFFLHFAGVYWRLLDHRARPTIALIVNCFGFMLWFISTVAINYSLGFFSHTSSLELAIVGASAWALYRTGLQTEIVTP